jgi:poly(ADP-ribose) glycohydrolase ARH3
MDHSEHPGASGHAPHTSTGDSYEDAVRERFVGSILGTFVGDALGMPLEGLTAATIFHRHGFVSEMLDARLGRGTYTDDTQMTIALAESLVACRGFDGEHAAGCLVRRLERKRGYGRGTIEALEQVAAGVPWQRAGAHTYGSGSFGNGSATRAAPVGLLFHRDLDSVLRVAREQSDVTHSHPLGRAGSAVIAAAVALALRWGIESHGTMRPGPFLALVADGLEDKEGLFRESLEKVEHVLGNCPAPAADATAPERLELAEAVTAVLGNDTRAFQSVPAALYCFLATPDEPETSVMTAVGLGGDTDTIAAMTGALAGAYRGARAWPGRWIDRLESGPRGRDYVMGLAEDLFLVWLEVLSRTPLRPPVLPT